MTFWVAKTAVTVCYRGWRMTIWCKRCEFEPKCPYVESWGCDKVSGCWLACHGALVTTYRFLSVNLLFSVTIYPGFGYALPKKTVYPCRYNSCLYWILSIITFFLKQYLTNDVVIQRIDSTNAKDKWWCS